MKKFLVLLFVVLVAGPALARGCDETERGSDAWDANGLQVISIEARAGSLDVITQPGARVEASWRSCADDVEDLRDMTVEGRRRGGTLSIETVIPEFSWKLFGSNYAKIDLELVVPPGVEIRIDDSSGEINVTGVASLRINDGSGPIRIDDVVGEVRIEDGSGLIDIENVGGPVWIDDGSGPIRVERVARDVIVDDDGSGPISIEDVEGNVEIRDDGSGSIDVEDVGGDLTVGDSGSGGVHYRRIEGRIDVEGHSVRSERRF